MPGGRFYHAKMTNYSSDFSSEVGKGMTSSSSVPGICWLYIAAFLFSATSMPVEIFAQEKCCLTVKHFGAAKKSNLDYEMGLGYYKDEVLRLL